MKDLIFPTPSSLSILDSVYACSTSCRSTFNELKAIAPPPEDYLHLQKALSGVLRSAQAAIGLLVEPNQKANELLDRLSLLKNSIDSVYIESKQIDLSTGVDRTLSAFSPWRALARTDEASSQDHDGYAVALGVHLLLRLHNSKKMSETFCDAIRKDKSLQMMSSTEVQAFVFSDLEHPPAWANRHKRELAEFIRNFETSPDLEHFKTNFNDSARAQLKANAEHPKRGQREGVLTRHTLSQDQFKEVLRPTLRPPFKDIQDQKLVIWLTCFSGLSFELLKELPLGEPGSGSVVCLDIEQGCLCKNFSALAPDLPKQTGSGIPTGMSLRVPLSQELHQRLSQLISAIPSAARIGDLIEPLLNIKNTDAIFQSLDDFAPSWAKLKNTVGIQLRAWGMDSFLVALLTSDFGHTGKSKLHYSRISNDEIHQACELAFSKFGFNSPVILHDLQLPFGSPLAPTQKQLKEAASFSRSIVDGARLGRNVKDQHRLIEFHNNYSLSVAFRICAGLALRSIKAIPLPTGELISLAEKAVNGREGGMFALVPPYISTQVRLYRAHCKALLSRSPHLQKTQFGLRLVQGSFNNLIQCSVNYTPLQISSTDTVNFVFRTQLLAADFGRKYLENTLRNLRVKTTDIDRVLRHEYIGQEQLCSEATESTTRWAQRMSPVLDQILLEVFGPPLVGLRGEDK